VNRSANSEQSADAGPTNPGEMFTRMWSDFAAKMASAGMAPGAASPAAASPDMARQMRDMFFKAWSEACDQYMRSEEFRRMMRESMTAAIELRKQLNAQLGEFQHAMQGASRQDVDRLLQGIDMLDRRVNETFEELIGRFDSLSKRLDELETRCADSPAAGRKTPEKKTAAKKGPGKKTRGTKQTGASGSTRKSSGQSAKRSG